MTTEEFLKAADPYKTIDNEGPIHFFTYEVINSSDSFPHIGWYAFYIPYHKRYKTHLRALLATFSCIEKRRISSLEECKAVYLKLLMKGVYDKSFNIYDLIYD